MKQFDTYDKVQFCSSNLDRHYVGLRSSKRENVFLTELDTNILWEYARIEKRMT